MKIILSRKGFDSGEKSGRYPSPILPNGKTLSFPIPSSESNQSWGDIETQDMPIQKIVRDLLPEEYFSKTLHIDPDLMPKKENCPQGWRPALGQVGAAAGHLINQKVNQGDLFLFFGWFRKIRINEASGKWEYYGESFHSLFGWLEIDSVINVKHIDQLTDYPFLSSHPHYYAENEQGKHNLIFIGKEQSEMISHHYGGGVFQKFTENLILTKKGYSRSIWSLPNYFDPRKTTYPALSYHSDLKRWRDDNENSRNVILDSVARGQEFVIDSQYYPQIENWAVELIQQHY